MKTLDDLIADTFEAHRKHKAKGRQIEALAAVIRLRALQDARRATEAARPASGKISGVPDPAEQREILSHIATIINETTRNVEAVAGGRGADQAYDGMRRITDYLRGHWSTP